MGTEKIDDLQSEIKTLIKRLDWSQKRLAREIYCSLHDDDDVLEIRRMEEKVKKSLSRPTTSHELLEQYYQVVVNHPEFQKSQQIDPCYLSIGVLDSQSEKKMKDISKLITKIIKERA